ncbi:putative sulfate exporter family transporter [Tistrella bauzanensis]|uniref:YeiH family protein n=1 Tax=Tistrella TaxID=171436 RepID=UPI0031F69519
MTTVPSTQVRSRAGRLLGKLPGLALAGAIGAAAILLARMAGAGLVSPVLVAIGLGLVLRAMIGRAPAMAVPGLAVASKPLMRLGVALLGLQVTAGDILGLGLDGIAAALAALAATLALAQPLGRLLGVEPRLATVIGGGTAICGASAAAAVGSAVRAHDDEIAYAVGVVTLFGTAAMALWPLLGTALGLDPRAYGLWIGASVHEVAQVVAAGFQHGTLAGETAVIAKLARVAMLAPVVGLLVWIAARAARRTTLADAEHAAASVPVPWFAVGFVALAGLNSLGVVPDAVRAAGAVATPIMLTVALAAIGFGTDLGRVRARGMRPVLLGLCLTITVAAVPLAVVTLLA